MVFKFDTLSHCPAFFYVENNVLENARRPWQTGVYHGASEEPKTFEEVLLLDLRWSKVMKE